MDYIGLHLFYDDTRLSEGVLLLNKCNPIQSISDN